jgi:SIR2-like protein
MQLIQKGPDIPEHLLQAHEAGRVVFFCGAGISYPAGLPGFKVLVESVRDKLGAEFSSSQASAFKRELYDTVLGLLEGEIVGQRERVRRAVAEVLQPNLNLPDALATHEALLTLSLTRDRRQRIITTNFDRLFEEVKKKNGLSYRSYEAPLLPVPKSRWDGVVYLHGILTEKPTAADLDRLVLSSGDFGLAYLTERWAARFVSELFRSLTVCFVGYSINDAVLRYMMDALAADRLLGESTPEVFAFGSYSARRHGGLEAATAEWLAKNVTPILYRDDKHHRYLHETLREWARVYRDGVLGKESIVIRYAKAKPVRSTEEDDFTGRMLWALSDSEGLPAKRFAQLDPLPSLDWLEAMSEMRYGHDDLDRFGVRANLERDDKLEFSMVARPSPYTLSPHMQLVGHYGAREGRLDDVMRWLAVWLARHTNNPKLLLWVGANGPHLHPQFAWQLEHALKEHAVPPALARLWRLVLVGRLYDLARPMDLYAWRDRLIALGYTQVRRIELVRLLSPRVKLSRPFRMVAEDKEAVPKAEDRVRDLVEWEIVLASDHARNALEGLQGRQQWHQLLIDMLPDFTALVRDAFDLMRELEGASERSDLSYIALPSISEHEQNRDFHDWTLLVELVRDAWVATAAASPELARAEVTRWLSLKYPIFRRLAFFAATERGVFLPEQALDILVQDPWWLWSSETQREAIRLLVALAPVLDAASAERLQQRILEGPDRLMFREDAEGIDRLIEREIGLRLRKYRGANGVLTGVAQDRLNEIEGKYAAWRPDEDERDEFPFWMGDGREWGTFTQTPIARRELVAWLRDHQRADDMNRDDWDVRCKSDFPRVATALLDLAGAGQWYADRWRSALQAWTELPLLTRSWRRLARQLVRAPDAFLREAAHALSYWLEAQAKNLVSQQEHFFSLSRRLIALYRNEPIEAGNDVIFRSINHPIGHTLQAMFNWWYRQDLRDGQRLTDDVSGTFTDLTRVDLPIYRYGRVLLGANVIALFRVDPAWTEHHLLPLFDWENSVQEAAAVWKGFLWMPRLYQPLIAQIKAPFLATVRHYDALGDHGEQYAGLLTYAVLEAPDLFTLAQKREAMAAMPDVGLRPSALTVLHALQGAGEQRGAYWMNRARPFLQTLWPQAVQRRSPAISEAFARISVASGDAFPDAYETVHGWLMQSDEIGLVPHELVESEQCRKFPETALALLDATIANDLRWPRADLTSCLDGIKAARPELEIDYRYRRLEQLVRRLGAG